jgi:DNA-directed RNA polymerase subunit RPC12/RpoP
MPETMTMVVCSECRRENEPERVYCHDCGGRLDRSAIKVRKDDVKDAQRRVKKLFDPQRAKIRATFFGISKVLLGALAVAVVIQMILPPDVPALAKTDMLASQVRFDLENATLRHQPAQLRYTEDEINAFLVYALKTKHKALDKPLLDFQRAFVGFREGACAVTMERSLFGYSVYTSCTYAVAIKDGKINAAAKGASVGRLPIHPQVAQYVGLLLSDLWFALDSEARLVAKLGAIEFHDKTVVLTALQK